MFSLALPVLTPLFVLNDGPGASTPMTPIDEPDLPRTRPEIQAQRLGFALRDLAAELVDERRRAAQLRHQVAELQAQLESRKQAPEAHR